MKGIYPGGKNGDGVYQTLINQIPPHEIYVEPFPGSGAVLRHLKPAVVAIGIDLKSDNGSYIRHLEHGHFISGCGIQWLKKRCWTGTEFVYLDPPYPWPSRLSYKPRYEFELTDEDHDQILSIIVDVPVPVMISTYPNDQYDAALHGWRRMEMMVPTHGGVLPEHVYMNYEEPLALHDYRYLGEDYRARERIKRMQARWKGKFKNLSQKERLAMLELLQELSADIDGNDDARRYPSLISAIPESGTVTAGEAIP